MRAWSTQSGAQIRRRRVHRGPCRRRARLQCRRLQRRRVRRPPRPYTESGRAAAGCVIVNVADELLELAVPVSTSSVERERAR